jgi:hypothetical protein
MSLIGQTRIEGESAYAELIYMPTICHLLCDDACYLCGGNVSALWKSHGWCDIVSCRNYSTFNQTTRCTEFTFDGRSERKEAWTLSVSRP